MLTALRPRIAEVGRTGREDAYVRIGDPVGFRHMCPEAVSLIWAVKLKPLESVRVWLQGGALEETEHV